MGEIGTEDMKKRWRKERDENARKRMRARGRETERERNSDGFLPN